MDSYLGIVIENSLKSPAMDAGLQVVASKQVGTWNFLLVEAQNHQLDEQIERLQSSMVDDDCWYAHYFKGNQIIVVYADRIFHTTLHPKTWQGAIDYGQKHGIPAEQLDFAPHSVRDVTRFFARVESLPVRPVKSSLSVASMTS